MDTDNDRQSDKGARTVDLEDFFAAARHDSAPPSEAFLTRLDTLALSEQRRLQLAASSHAASLRGRWQDLRRALGGWPGVAGLTAAGVAGLIIGISPPDLLTLMLGLGDTALAVDPLSGFDLALLEG